MPPSYEVTLVDRDSPLLPAARRLMRDYLLLPDAWEAGTVPADPPEWMQRQLAALPEPSAAPNGALLVALEDDDPVGIVQVVLREQGAEVQRLFVAPPYRERGHGDRLVRGALEAARDLGATEMFLDVQAHRLDAIRLYERHGFTQSDTPRPPRFGVVVMRRRL